MNTGNVDASWVVHDIISCGKHNNALVAWACEAQQNNMRLSTIPFSQNVEVITYMLVLSQLVKECVNNQAFASDIIYHIRERINNNCEPTEYNEKLSQLYHNANHDMEFFSHSRRKPDTVLTPTSMYLRNTALERSVQMSLLEKVHSRECCHSGSALVGLSLSHYIFQRGYTAEVESGINRKYTWPLGISWAHDIISWNLELTLSEPISLREQLSTLMSPTTMCASIDHGSPDGYARDFHTIAGYSNFLTVAGLLQNSPLFSPLTNNTRNISYDRLFGNSNIKYMQTRMVTKDDMNNMRLHFPAKTSTFKTAGYESWKVIRSALLFGSLLLLGWGSEIVFSLWLLKQPEEQDIDMFDDTEFIMATGGFDEASRYRIIGIWRLAQLAFPLFLSISLMGESVFGLPFMVVGLWKCGFPETVTNMIQCMRTHVCGHPIGHIEAFAKFCNGIGTILHHTAVAWYAVICITGLYTPHLFPNEWTSIALPLLIQHWFTIVKYISVPLYGACEFALEVWFEIEAFSLLNRLTYYNELVATSALLFAHWLYWTAGFISITMMMLEKIVQKPDTPKPKRESIDRFMDASKKRTMVGLNSSQNGRNANINRLNSTNSNVNYNGVNANTFDYDDNVFGDPKVAIRKESMIVTMSPL
eukprot:m.95117 g.95117  ORF g.95117 m.95117 type:complete len:645 (+) comp13478_c0_seq3:39-1973(+)